MLARPTREQIQPTGEWVLVEPLQVDNKTVGGILMPNDDNGPDSYGMVLAVGPGFYQNGVLVEPKVEPGQVLMLRNGRGLPLRVGAENLLLMTERDFLSVINNPLVAV